MRAIAVSQPQPAVAETTTPHALRPSVAKVTRIAQLRPSNITIWHDALRKRQTEAIAQQRASGCVLEFDRADVTGQSVVFFLFDSLVRVRNSKIYRNKELLICDGLSTLEFIDSRVEDNDSKNAPLTDCPTGVCQIVVHNSVVAGNRGSQSANCTL